MYWYNHLKKALEDEAVGLKCSNLDPCVFYGHGMVVLVYVDDCLFFGPDLTKIDDHIQALKKLNLQLTPEDTGAYAFLGVDIGPNKKDGKSGFVMTQNGLTKKILKTMKMEDCHGKATPTAQEPLGTDEKGEPFNEEWSYASVVGMLLYLSSNSRPNIQYAVNQCARFTHNPKTIHGEAVKRIVHYLKKTLGEGLEFTPTKAIEMDLYLDADFAGLWSYEHDQDPVCVKSRTGFVITLGTCPVMWVSKLQTEIALSTLEAEYIVLSTVM